MNSASSRYVIDMQNWRTKSQPPAGQQGNVSSYFFQELVETKTEPKLDKRIKFVKSSEATQQSQNCVCVCLGF